MKKIPDNAKKVFEGERFTVWQWEQELFDGSYKTFESVTRDDVSTVIAVTKDKKLLFLEETQAGKESVYTFPSGTLEKEDTEESCARRELLEETGYQTDNLVFWYSKSAGNSVDFKYHIFIAKDCSRISEQQLDPGERISIKEMSLDEILEQIESIRFKNSTLYPILIKAKYSEDYRRELQTLLGIN